MTGTRRPTLDDLADLEAENALLLAIVEATSSGPDVEPLAAAVARLIVEATATDVCFVHVLDDAGRSLTLAGATPPFNGQAGRVRLPIGTGVAGWVAEHGRPAVIVDDKHADPRYVPIAALRGVDYTSMASVPMTSDLAGLVGVLNVHTVVRREFTARDIRLLTSIGRLVAGALHSARLHRRLVARERANERFTEQVIAAQETERRRLAGDIHDGISQRLVSLGYHLDAAAGTLRSDPAYAEQQLILARELADITVDEARIAIGGLRPPVLDDLGLAGGLTSLSRTVPDLDCELILGDERLPEHVEIALYRIAQEALQNVQKHARATRVELRFAVREGTVRLEVSDDGCGFDTGVGGFEARDLQPEASGYGMRSMAERAELVGGTLTVRSRPGSGTTVTVTVPATPA
ncbi:GAF domain-containing sensor histidine kinase [Pseudonocardia alaniniphila]|uniref:GAF domain-containing sensor histidine kinase n=1 Tax=Pseudonocardia alaniniphila TaxID=75291 RepID=A0ABS9TJE5_9PSEU|nr:GAF domain-containing sensor histidine kinase [Pseudonocardia alaniniphila]MCH6168603.1 GAF domain-containing sensor histidine kinase [Pseudonocardia alaniniphila]